MKTLKIEIPEGFEIANFDSKTGEIKFKPTPIDIKERIKTLDDVYVDNGTTKAEFEKLYGFLPNHVKAYLQMGMITKSLNQDWEADWNDNSQRKYFQYFYMGGDLGSSGFRYYVCDDWLACSFVGSRLCFKSSELAKYAGETFIDVYKEFHYKNI